MELLTLPEVTGPTGKAAHMWGRAMLGIPELPLDSCEAVGNCNDFIHGKLVTRPLL
jgi:hypothetical protein